ncbi:metallopeptidase family protein [Brachybacterium aquaticum]|uniref:Putative Zn-dependent protease with MMP-like domain n=1 Tax=Brachybacterium aquaticum TaxID=1432564 RepID=A0A841ACU6_9MICO|nr:metallopeptidase family protein [Brachybacterium aquaticum]MBB5830928.1 putative Zn-dependent protease with MMP-like domain [Brachybacterium aquaticum]
MDLDPGRSPAPRPARGPRRRDRHGRGSRFDLIPPHLPGHRTRRERFDDLVADAGAALTERFPRRLAHLQVLVEEVPPADPAPWEDAVVLLGRALPATREHPPRVIVYRRPLQTRCTTEAELETLVRQVLSEQIGSLLSIAPEDVDPEAWDV